MNLSTAPPRSCAATLASRLDMMYCAHEAGFLDPPEPAAASAAAAASPAAPVDDAVGAGDDDDASAGDRCKLNVCKNPTSSSECCSRIAIASEGDSTREASYPRPEPSVAARARHTFFFAQLKAQMSRMRAFSLAVNGLNSRRVEVGFILIVVVRIGEINIPTRGTGQICGV